VLFFTHCCAKKDNRLKQSKKTVSPAQLYQALPTQRFIKRCAETGVEWAIFSDKYGFVFPNDRVQWYEKHPNTLTQSDKRKLFEDALLVLRQYDLVYFYYNPGRIHPIYQELVNDIRSKGKNVREITHLDDIRRVTV